MVLPPSSPRESCGEALDLPNPRTPCRESSYLTPTTLLLCSARPNHSGGHQERNEVVRYCEMAPTTGSFAALASLDNRV